MTINESPASLRPGSPPRAEVKEGGWTAGLVGRMVLLVLTAEVALMVFSYPLNGLVQIGTEFQTNQVAWLQTSGALTAAVASTLIGNLADKFGKRRVILTVLVVAFAGLLLSTFAPSFGLLLVGRVLQGVTLCLTFLLPSLVRDLWPTKTIPLAISLVATGAGAVSVFVSITAGYAIEHFGWRTVFLIPAILVAVIIILFRFLVPESPVRSPGRSFSIFGMVLFGLGLAGVLLAVSLGPVLGWGPPVIATLGAGVLLLVAFAVQSFKVRNPVVDLREFKHFPFLVTFLFSLLGSAISVWFIVINTTVALTPNTGGWGFGQSPEQASIYFALFTLGSFIGGLAAGPVLARIPAPAVAAGVQAIVVVGFVVAAFSLADPVLFGVAAILLGLSGGANFATVYNLVVLVVETHKQATMASVVSVGGNIGSAVLPVILFACLNSTATIVDGAPLYTLDGLQMTMFICAAIGVVMVVLAVALSRSQRSRADLLAGTHS
jgi:MFS family permease